MQRDRLSVVRSLAPGVAVSAPGFVPEEPEGPSRVEVLLAEVKAAIAENTKALELVRLEVANRPDEAPPLLKEAIEGLGRVIEGQSVIVETLHLPHRVTPEYDAKTGKLVGAIRQIERK